MLNTIHLSNYCSTNQIFDKLRVLLGKGSWLCVSLLKICIQQNLSTKISNFCQLTERLGFGSIQVSVT